MKNAGSFSYKEGVFGKKKRGGQEEFWIETQRLPKLSAGRYFNQVEEVLKEIAFAEQVHGLCRPAYSQRADGRPGIDPVVYFKMLMVGFFENLPSERAIAARCEDSLAVRAFLGYGLEAATPEHSSLSVIRRRLSAEIYQAVFELILKALKHCGLLKGRYVGIDSSVMEANASLKSLADLANVRQLQQAGLRVVIADGSAHKRQEHRLPEPERQALQKARETLQSKSGRQLMRLRGQHIERSFAHILDCGGMRRATLRGQANLQKRYVFAAACYNLSQLLRKQFGCGTLKMALATALMRFFKLLAHSNCSTPLPSRHPQFHLCL